jgi:hypothetical protein
LTFELTVFETERYFPGVLTQFPYGMTAPVFNVAYVVDKRTDDRQYFERVERPSGA